ncbi:hypothetical protein [Roseobacter weihaiensis]|uniref:hypothetical protein n=1 Tax=Roseobacter weihaiensis TaxID=2763262 RepID=UPI001D0AB96D|nr:hypothetical protein [Roseobacter sp. H9]
MSILLLSGRRFIAASVILIALSGCANAPAADALDTTEPLATTSAQSEGLDAHIAEASQRFEIPERWIGAVTQAAAPDDRLNVGKRFA